MSTRSGSSTLEQRQRLISESVNLLRQVRRALPVLVLLWCTCEGSQDGLQKPHVRVRASFTSCEVRRPRHPYVATLVSVSRTPMRTTHFTNHCTEQPHPKTRARQHTYIFLSLSPGHTNRLSASRIPLCTGRSPKNSGGISGGTPESTHIRVRDQDFFVLPARAMRSTLRGRGADLGPDLRYNKVNMTRTRVKMSSPTPFVRLSPPTSP